MLDVFGGILVIFAAIVVNAAAGSGPNRFSIVAVLLAACGCYLIYNGYDGRPSIVGPWVPWWYN
jgi:hypothetical protein